MQRYLFTRTCNLCSRSSSVLSRRDYHSKHSAFVTQHDAQRRHSHAPWFSLPVQQQFLTLPAYRCGFSTSSRHDGDDKNGKTDFSKDPEVKKWLSNIQSDFAEELGKSKDNYDKGKEEDEGRDENGKDHPPESSDADKRAADTTTRGSDSGATNPWTKYTTQKYEKFSMDKSQIIYDYDEEQRRLAEGIVEEEMEVEELVLERGRTGVFDIEELVDFLREENARDIAVIQVPPEMKYISYMVIVTSLSQRHINALAETIRRIYKKKKGKKDPSIICEGKSTNWVALDMGNIALHIMKPDIRLEYDLETLWTVGAQFDDKCQEIEENPLDFFNAMGHFTKTSDPPENFPRP
ncbi:uncharacterized protein LOC122250204 [Penaeus japonicus]|uniref:uncharacterized protein LOC122250204 n=1 Tax=Penaeus japonicus TaxID=27405 RepID=UPI001C7144F8|nr:uncharacterized protein LOC122250204 [Penaeus japonicus]